jgi:hypothetical protein
MSDDWNNLRVISLHRTFGHGIMVFFIYFSLKYMSGFGNEFSSEDPRCPNALPVGQVKKYSDLITRRNRSYS